MVVTNAISNLIRENKVYNISSAIQTGAKYGMILLDDYLWELFTAGKISAEDMMLKCRRPADIREKMKRAGLAEGAAVNRDADEA
jgi:twitching motility protein PilT